MEPALWALESHGGVRWREAGRAGRGGGGADVGPLAAVDRASGGARLRVAVAVGPLPVAERARPGGAGAVGGADGGGGRDAAGAAGADGVADDVPPPGGAGAHGGVGGPPERGAAGAGAGGGVERRGAPRLWGAVPAGGRADGHAGGGHRGDSAT